jgi:hypothetical protein
LLAASGISLRQQVWKPVNMPHLKERADLSLLKPTSSMAKKKKGTAAHAAAAQLTVSDSSPLSAPAAKVQKISNGQF